jgi:hypothetical protein
MGIIEFIDVNEEDNCYIAMREGEVFIIINTTTIIFK